MRRVGEGEVYYGPYVSLYQEKKKAQIHSLLSQFLAKPKPFLELKRQLKFWDKNLDKKRGASAKLTPFCYGLREIVNLVRTLFLLSDEGTGRVSGADASRSETRCFAGSGTVKIF
jgi:hypothetical protein